MGAAFQTLPLSDTDTLVGISPSRADWLTAHADATGLAVVEVERLWRRFKQLTGTNELTRLNPDNSALPSEIANDVFVKNLLKHFPRSKSEPNNIPFGYFISVIQWFEAATVPDKLGAIFMYLNNGDPIDAVMIGKLLRHVYRESQEDEIKALSLKFMQQLGSSENGKLNKQQFIAGVQRCVPANELEELLHFEIIPTHILDEANMLPSLGGSATDLRRTQNVPAQDAISDAVLKQVANQAARKDWANLALALGFLEYDIEAYKVKNNNDPSAAMFEMLQMWRDQEGPLATKNRLKYYLETSGLSELTSSVK